MKTRKNAQRRSLSAVMAITAILALVVTLASCKDPDDGGTTIVSEETVGYAAGASTAARQQTNFSYSHGLLSTDIKPLSYYINDPASVTIKDGKLSINLGTPRTEHLTFSANSTPNDAKVFTGFSEFVTADGKYRLFCMKDANTYAFLVYADRDLNVNNINLKQGWNYVISSSSGSTSTMTATATTTLPSGFKWTVAESDYSYSSSGGTLTITGLPSGSTYGVIVFNSGTDVSDFATAMTDSDSMQAVGTFASGNSFTLYNLNGITTGDTWTASGNFPVVLFNNSSSTEYRYATVPFTNGSATVTYSAFTAVTITP